MFELPIIWEWVGFAVRWVHVIPAIAWTGSSFYFIALDLGLRRGGEPGGAAGDGRQGRGGGGDLQTYPPRFGLLVITMTSSLLYMMSFTPLPL